MPTDPKPLECVSQPLTAFTCPERGLTAPNHKLHSVAVWPRAMLPGPQASICTGACFHIPPFCIIRDAKHSICAVCAICTRSAGPMDKASASGAGDSRFESWADHAFASDRELHNASPICAMSTGLIVSNFHIGTRPIGPMDVASGFQSSLPAPGLQFVFSTTGREQAARSQEKCHNCMVWKRKHPPCSNPRPQG